MSRILYLVHRVPYPPNRGDRIRSYHLLRYLAERAEVHLATLADEPTPSDTITELNRLCAAVAIEPLGTTRWLRAAASLARGRSATEGLFQSAALRSTIREWSRRKPFDAVVVFCSSMMQYASLNELSGLPIVVDLVDVDSQKFHDYARVRRGPKRWLYQLEGRRLRALEQSLPTRVKAVSLVSEAEADIYRSFCPNDRTLAIPNGVDLAYFQPRDPSSRRPRCVFVGALDYPPNIEGIRWFCREAWPRIRRQCPQATLAVVGRNPDPAVRQLASLPGVEIHGSVPDIRPHLADACVTVAPLQIARGVQNKVLEAMAMARPVIASPGAAEGLAVVAGTDLLIASTAEEWASAVCDTLDDTRRQQALGAAGRRFVESRHDWGSCLGRFAEVLPL